MTTIIVGSEATHNEKEVKTKYPVEEGLIAGTTKQENKEMLLKPKLSKITKRELVGMW